MSFWFYHKPRNKVKYKKKQYDIIAKSVSIEQLLCFFKESLKNNKFNELSLWNPWLYIIDK